MDLARRRFAAFARALCVALAAFDAGAVSAQTAPFENAAARLGLAGPTEDATVRVGLEALARAPCDRSAIMDLAARLVQIGRPRDAAEGQLRFARACGGPDSAARGAAELSISLADFPKALEAADELVRLAPDDADARYTRGLAFRGLGAHEYALVDFANAIGLGGGARPNDDRAARRMADAYAALDRPCEAMSAVQTWVALAPAARDTPAARALVANYSTRGDCEINNGAVERRAFPGRDRVVSVSAAVNGVRGLFHLDAGAPYVSFAADFAERARLPRSESARVTVKTPAGDTTGLLSRADTFKLGALEAKGVPALIVERGPSLGRVHDGRIGLTFLSRFGVFRRGDYIEIRDRGAREPAGDPVGTSPGRPAPAEAGATPAPNTPPVMVPLPPRRGPSKG